MKNRILALALITMVFLVAASCGDLENRILGYELEIISPESGVVFRQNEAPAVALQLQIRGWEEQQIQEFPIYVHLNGARYVEWKITGSRPAGAVTLTEPGEHLLEVILPLDDGSQLRDSITVSWVKPSPLDKVAGAVAGVVGMPNSDPRTSYLFLGVLAILVFGVLGAWLTRSGFNGFLFSSVLGLILTILILGQTPEGKQVVGWFITGGCVLAFFFVLRFLRIFWWRGDEGLAMGFQPDVPPAAAQIATRHQPQLPEGSTIVVLPPGYQGQIPGSRPELPLLSEEPRDPRWLRLLRGPTFDP